MRDEDGKKFELDVSWVCDESGKVHQRVSESVWCVCVLVGAGGGGTARERGGVWGVAWVGCFREIVGLVSSALHNKMLPRAQSAYLRRCYCHVTDVAFVKRQRIDEADDTRAHTQSSLHAPANSQPPLPNPQNGLPSTTS